MRSGGGSGEAGKSWILVVEDDATIARLVERAFVRLDYAVTIARNCAEARGAAGSVFHCGIFDIELPDGDGVAIASALLAAGWVRAAVFYTGSLDRRARDRAARFGRVIDKLAPFADLRDHVAELVKSRPSDGSAGVS